MVNKMGPFKDAIADIIAGQIITEQERDEEMEKARLAAEERNGELYRKVARAIMDRVLSNAPSKQQVVPAPELKIREIIQNTRNLSNSGNSNESTFPNSYSAPSPALSPAPSPSKPLPPPQVESTFGVRTIE